MNIFFLDKEPETCAQYHCDKHVVKMILETAQLLCTAHRVIDGKQWIDQSSGRRIKRWKLNGKMEDMLYKATHINHPSAVWARESDANYMWLYELFIHLSLEYTHRYGKNHLTTAKLSILLSQPPKNIFKGPMTKMPQAMPDYCKDDDSVTAYRNYYINEKQRMLKYTNREMPQWMK